MEDPVILPASRQTIDRSTIRSHLLSDPNDPFNRAPLKIEDVVPGKRAGVGMRVEADLVHHRHGHAGSHPGFQSGEEGAEAVQG